MIHEVFIQMYDYEIISPFIPTDDDKYRKYDQILFMYNIHNIQIMLRWHYLVSSDRLHESFSQAHLTEANNLYGIFFMMTLKICEQKPFNHIIYI